MVFSLISLVPARSRIRRDYPVPHGYFLQGVLIFFRTPWSPSKWSVLGRHYLVCLAPRRAHSLPVRGIPHQGPSSATLHVFTAFFGHSLAWNAFLPVWFLFFCSARRGNAPDLIPPVRQRHTLFRGW